MQARMFCAYSFKIYMKAQNMHVSMYFLHLVLTFTPHYIIMVRKRSIDAFYVYLLSFPPPV